MNRDSFTLDPLAPFRLDLTVWVLRRRPDNRMDRFERQTYRRVLVLDGDPVEVTVRQVGPADAPRLAVETRGGPPVATSRPAIAAALERLLGLREDLGAFEQLARTDERLGPLVRRFRGFKPPRFPSVFECLVNAIACQQITLTQGIRILNRFSASYGLALNATGDAPRAFPRPSDLASADPVALRQLGFSLPKARYVVDIASAIAAGHLDLEALRNLDDTSALARLRELRGVGRWTAEYALLRGLGRWHVFPGDDVGGRNNLQHWLGRDEPLDYASVHGLLQPW